jgi:hypothetical protein
MHHGCKYIKCYSGLLNYHKLRKLRLTTGYYRHYVGLPKSSKIRYQSVSSVILGNISVFPDVLHGAEPHLKKLQEITTDSLVNDVLWKDFGSDNGRMERFYFICGFI